MAEAELIETDERAIHSNKFTDDQVEVILAKLAFNNGNCLRTQKELRGTEWDVCEQTLRRWKRDYPDRYEQIRRDVLPRIREELAEDHTNLAKRQIEVSSLGTEEIHKRFSNQDELKKMSTSQIATSLGKLDVGSGIHTQRASELRDEPTRVVHEHRSFKQIAAGLKARGFDVQIIDGTAEEIPPEELPQEVEIEQPPDDEPTPEEAESA